MQFFFPTMCVLARECVFFLRQEYRKSIRLAFALAMAPTKLKHLVPKIRDTHAACSRFAKPRGTMGLENAVVMTIHSRLPLGVAIYTGRANACEPGDDALIA